VDGTELRARSIAQARQLGYGRLRPDVVALTEPGGLRAGDEVMDRVLVLNAVISCAHGLPAITARRWLADAHLETAMTAGESGYLDDLSEGLHLDDTARKLEVESLWTLVWALSLVPELDFATACGTGLADLLPDPASGDGVGGEVRAEARLRTPEELNVARDLAAVLAGALGDPSLRVGMAPGEVEPYVVWERHRALEWLHGGAWEPGENDR
jgi:hypothetical protein